MEDTWGRNEFALDDQRFLDQAYLTHEERERMFFDALERTREGLCACVFDASDRIQHMFWRYLEKDHPAPLEDPNVFGATIPDMYKRMDELVGRVRAKISSNDVLIVMSDHGFTSFRRGVNVNTWLLNEGYLVLKENADRGGDYLQGVDWSKTRAFAIGLTGIYLNRRGRERHGIVEDHECGRLKAEIQAKLKALVDPENGVHPIRNVYDSEQVYRGLYLKEAPDLIVGSESGYRVSWESVTGGLSEEIIEDNVKAWSGDHDVDPEVVPGVLFANREITAETPHIRDLAPTVLSLFAVPVPRYMEGQAIM